MSSKQASYKVRSQKKIHTFFRKLSQEVGKSRAKNLWRCMRQVGMECTYWGKGVMGSLSLQPATAYVGASLLPDSSVWLTVLPERGWAGMDDEYGDGPDVGRLSLGHSCIVLCVFPCD